MDDRRAGHRHHQIIMGVVGQTVKWIIAAIQVAILFGVAAMVPELIKEITGPG